MENIPNWFYRTSVKALILNKDNKFLLTREEKWWDLPWWWLEYGETPQDCIKRELFEEMWIKVKNVDKQPSYFVTTQKKNWVWISNIIYKVSVDIEDVFNFNPSDECLQVKFFNKQEVENEKIFPNVKEFINQFNTEL